MKPCRQKRLTCAVLVFCALLLPMSIRAQVTIDTSNPEDWKIGNGALTLDWRPGDGRIFSIQLTALPDQDLIDQTNRDRNGPKGFYMDNVGPGGGTPINGYYVDPDGSYIDWWNTYPANATNAFTWSQHHILFANDAGIHMYFVLDHNAADIAGGIGQIQWVFRGDLTQFTDTYSVNTGLGNLGATHVPLPDSVLFGSSDTGRNVQDATVDLHGLPLPADFRRQFYTKYDYSSYEYLHKAQGVYGANLAAWMVVPNPESLTGGPTKQDLIFTGNLLIMEAYSNHLNNQMSFPAPAGTPVHRLYGPFYLHFNNFSDSCSTPASLYREALSAAQRLKPSYDSETILLNNGYTPSSERGEVDLWVQGIRNVSLNQAWAVLSDENTLAQYSHARNQYWENIARGGVARFHDVAPGTYRLSVYVLGEWGETRVDGIRVRPRQHSFVPVRFTREDFGSAPPVWTIGTADRSAHEFLHGNVVNPMDLDSGYRDKYTNRLRASVQDDRQFWGNWNYWADFASTNGAVVYYATPVGNIPGTHDLTKWNYNQWHIFHPGLYAGIYNPSDDTTDGYQYICPAYVGDCTTAAAPDWEVHFTTTPRQMMQGSYAVLSVGLAATESDLKISLNGNPITWKAIKLSDADVRSGLSGTYQWIAFEWPASLLNAPGSDNVLTFNVNKTQGVMYDALRLEITCHSAVHESTGWNDYEYVNSTSYETANNSSANNK